MTYLGNVISRLMLERPGLSAAEVARKARLSTAYLSLLRSGKRNGATSPVLMRLAKALTDSETERAEIIAAHLKDESCGYYPDRIEITIRSGNRSGNGKNK